MYLNAKLIGYAALKLIAGYGIVPIMFAISRSDYGRRGWAASAKNHVCSGCCIELDVSGGMFVTFNVPVELNLASVHLQTGLASASATARC